MSVEQVDVAIVGGGPGGLAAALAIQRVDPSCRVKVYERASRLREIGFTVGLMGNGLNALEALDPAVFEAVSRELLEDGAVFRNDKHGSTLFTSPSAVNIFKQWNSRVMVGYLSWFRIQSILAQGLPAGVLQLGCSLEALAAQPGHEGVGLTFSDGRSVQASVAVGADGYQSKTRALLLGDGPPSYTGSAVWRGQCKAPEGWPFFESLNMSWAEGPQRIAVVRLREGRLAWQCVAPWPQDRLGELLSTRHADAEATRAASVAKKERCLALYADWAAPVQQVIAGTAPDTITEHGQFFRDTAQCQKWGEGPVSLLGDAAHLMTPFLGQGVNQTLEDALELGRAVGELGPSEAALRVYESVRIPAATRVHVGSVSIVTAPPGARPNELEWYGAHPDILAHMPPPLQPKSSPAPAAVAARCVTDRPVPPHSRRASSRAVLPRSRAVLPRSRLARVGPPTHVYGTSKSANL